MKKLFALLLVVIMVVSLCPVTLVAIADETVDTYARQVEKIPYYSNGQIKFRHNHYGAAFGFEG